MIIKGTDWCPGVAYARAYYIKADRFVSRKRARERDWNRDEIDVTYSSFWLTNDDDDDDDDDSRKLSSRVSLFPALLRYRPLSGATVIDGCEYTSEDGSSSPCPSLFCPLAR
jgi:hypothetical protein